MPSEWCDGYLKLVKDGQPVNGESSDVDYPGSIEIVSFTFGSSSGFSDEDDKEDKKYATNDRSMDLGRSMEMLFSNDEDFEKFEGTDLTEVDSCKLTVVKELDVSSPDLFRAYCSMQDLDHREVFESATLFIKKATGGDRKVFLTFVFNDVLVTSYALDIGGDAVPKETISLVFGKCRVEYKPQQADGSLGAAIKGGWDMIERGAW